MCDHEKLRALDREAFLAATTWREGASREQRFRGGIALYGNCPHCNSTFAIEVESEAA